MLEELLTGHVILTDEAGQEEEYLVVRVLDMNERRYVLLQSQEHRDEEPLILRVEEGDDELRSPSLIGIDDDDEWEQVAEAFDEILFEIDDRA
jgi:putative Holliday junction resolvase